MKNSKLIFTMASMASMLAFTGCSTEISLTDSEGVETPTIVIETSMEENTVIDVVTNASENNEGSSQESIVEEVQTDSDAVSQPDSVEDVFVEVNEDWNYVLTPEQEFAYLFEVKYDESTCKEYATMICQGEQGAYWTYETGKHEVGQCSALEILESPVECIYLNEGGTITALNIYDGKILWQNSDYQGSGSVCTMDESDNLYVAGFDSPDLIVIDANGKTLHRVAKFGDYFWPYDMSVEDNMLTIHFDSEDNAKVVMDIRDYSYTIY